MWADPFKRASLRLTALYVMLTVVLVAAFSVVLLWSLAGNINGNVEGDFATEAQQARFVARTVQNLRNEVLLIDGLTIAAVSVLSYLLARRTLRPVKHSVRVQEEFVSNASHKLRTPLAILKTKYQVAAREQDEPGARAFLEAGLDEVDRMTRIVEDLLTLSRADARTERAALGTLEVEGLRRRAIDRVQVYAAQYDVRLVFDGPAAVSQVNGDADQLERVLVNVIKNAIEHSPAGNSVWVRLRQRARKVEIQVEDAGEGISGEDLPHVMKRFYRGRSSHFTSPGGSGLGLPVAKAIIDEHRGSLDVSSVPGSGTVVTVALPAASSSLHLAGTE